MAFQTQLNLNFEPGHYTITKVIEPNVLEIEGTWFIKLKGIGDNTSKEELKKWLQTGKVVRIIPYSRNNSARIISDVWLGNTHINRQFSNYKTDNFIQAFEQWNIKKQRFGMEEDELVKAFYMAESVVSDKLKDSFNSWISSRYPQRKRIPPQSFGEIPKKREKLQNQMIEEFYKWKEEQST